MAFRVVILSMFLFVSSPAFACKRLAGEYISGDPYDCGKTEYKPSKEEICAKKTRGIVGSVEFFTIKKPVKDRVSLVKRFVPRQLKEFDKLGCDRNDLNPFNSFENILEYVEESVLKSNEGK